MPIREAFIRKGRTVTATWSRGRIPEGQRARRASGLCITHDGQAVLVAKANLRWTLPGGKLERHEAAAGAFVREAHEEACAVLTAWAYLGALRIDDPDHPGGAATYYEARFWGRAVLLPFNTQHEMLHRAQVPVNELMAVGGWRTPQIMGAIVAAAQEEEDRRQGR